jgi:uncharacterized protein (TIGR03382 family)
MSHSARRPGGMLPSLRTKREVLSAAIALAAFASTSRLASADDKHSCCALGVQDGACVAQAGPCGTPSYGVDFSDLTVVWQGGDCHAYVEDPSQWEECDGWPADPVADNATFPSGTDGYISWVEGGAGPSIGFCLVAPDSNDPTHADPVDPMGCIRASMSPGVGVGASRWSVPVDSKWDAYEWCYGAPDGNGSCSSLADSSDSTVVPTPEGFCCGPAKLFSQDNAAGPGEWNVYLAQEIPGVAPNKVFLGPDGGLVLVPYVGDAGILSEAPDACLSAYGEPEACGSAPDGSPPSFLGLTQTNSSQGGGCNAGGTPLAASAVWAVAVAAGVALWRRRTPMGRRPRR